MWVSRFSQVIFAFKPALHHQPIALAESALAARPEGPTATNARFMPGALSAVVRARLPQRALTRAANCRTAIVCARQRHSRTCRVRPSLGKIQGGRGVPVNGTSRSFCACNVHRCLKSTICPRLIFWGNAIHSYVCRCRVPRPFSPWLSAHVACGAVLMHTTAGDVRNADLLYLHAHTCTLLGCLLCVAVSQVKITAGGKTDQTEPHKKTYRTSFTKKFMWDDADSVSEMVVDVYDGYNTLGDKFIGDSHSHILRSKSYVSEGSPPSYSGGPVQALARATGLV